MTGKMSYALAGCLMLFSSISMAEPVQVAAGNGTTFLRYADGTVWGCGANLYGELGTEQTQVSTPVVVAADTARVIPGLGWNTFFLKRDGTLWGSGGNSYGELGNGLSAHSVYRPVPVMGNGYVDAAAGLYFSLAIKADGSLWAWGSNSDGQLGNGNTRDQKAPIPVGTEFSAVVAGAAHVVALKTDGTLWTWGRNDHGQLGDGGFTSRAKPAQIGEGFRLIAAGAHHSAAIKADGSLWVWGRNDTGALGNGRFDDSAQPTQVPGQFAAVAAGIYHTAALDSAGNLYTAGLGRFGQLGDQVLAVFGRSEFVAVGQSFTAISSRAEHMAGQKMGGRPLAWGNNSLGQLCDGGAIVHQQPVLIAAGGFVMAAAGIEANLALRNDGSLWVWGENAQGEYGDGRLPHYPQRSVPTPVGAGFVSIAGGWNSFWGVKSDQSLWAWGDNTYGQLGNGATGNVVLKAVRIGEGFQRVVGHTAHSLALKSDGSLWAWGENSRGQLGDGTQQPQLQPVAVGNGFVDIAVGDSHSLGVKADGSLWAWGDNRSGQLGDGSFTDSALPIRIADGVNSVYAGRGFSMALTAQGQLYGWGAGCLGRLGFSSADSNRPVLLGTGWKALAVRDSHVVAIAQDGSLWTWGVDYRKPLMGDASDLDAAAPQLLGEGFVALAAGLRSNVAIKSDGSLWTWGVNYFGEAGDGRMLYNTLSIIDREASQ